MKLLDDIVASATDGQSQPAVLLRKLLVLAAKVKNEKLRAWAEKELMGYGPADPLPDYRVTQTQSLGVFFGIAGSRMENIPLPTLLLEERHRELVEKADFRHGIASYQLGPGQDATSGQWQIPWSPNLVARYQSTFYRDQYALKSAWQVVPATFIAMMIDTIQTRVLLLALDLQAELGPGHEDIASIPADRVDRSVINIIYGGHNVIAGRTGNVLQAETVTVSKDDLASLEVALAGFGVDKAELCKLQSAIEEDKADNPQKAGVGLRARAWISDVAARVAGKMGEAGLEVAKVEAVKHLTSLVGQFLGS